MERGESIQIVGGHGRTDASDHTVISAETERLLLEALEALGEQACAGQEYQRHRHLRDDERPSREKRALLGASPSAGERAGRVRARHRPGGSGGEQRARDKREAECEGDDRGARVNVEGKILRAVKRQ